LVEFFYLFVVIKVNLLSLSEACCALSVKKFVLWSNERRHQQHRCSFVVKTWCC